MQKPCEYTQTEEPLFVRGFGIPQDSSFHHFLNNFSLYCWDNLVYVNFLKNMFLYIIKQVFLVKISHWIKNSLHVSHKNRETNSLI